MTGNSNPRGTIGDFAALQQKIERAWTVSSFHRDHWRAHGVKDGWVPPSAGHLSELPVVTKEHLLQAQRREPPWGGNLCIPEDRIAQVHLTTGTSGIGQERYAVSASDVEIMGRSWGPQYRAIGLVRGDIGCFTIPVSFFCAGLSALEGARLHGLVPLLTGVTSKELMLDLMTHHRISYLYGIESLLLQLGNLARDRGLAGHWRGKLKGIQSVGTSPQLLALAETVFGAPVFEVYGCTQAVAKIASTCHLGVGGGSNHFHHEHLFIETRDPRSGALVEEGEAELILSTPFREASPVIRFAIRDKVQLVPSGSCPCGALSPAFVPGSLGRLDSMLKIRGVNLWPQQVEKLLLGHPNVLDFRAEVLRGPDGGDELQVKVVSIGSSESAFLADSLGALIREHTMVRPTVEIVEKVEEAPGAYKVRRWIDLRKAIPASTPT